MRQEDRWLEAHRSRDLSDHSKPYLRGYKRKHLERWLELRTWRTSGVAEGLTKEKRDRFSKPSELESSRDKNSIS